MYKGFVITSNGAEDIAKSEIKDLIKCSNLKEENTVVKFNFKELIDL